MPKYVPRSCTVANKYFVVTSRWIHPSSRFAFAFCSESILFELTRNIHRANVLWNLSILVTLIPYINLSFAITTRWISLKHSDPPICRTMTIRSAAHDIIPSGCTENKRDLELCEIIFGEIKAKDKVCSRIQNTEILLSKAFSTKFLQISKKSQWDEIDSPYGYHNPGTPGKI